MKLTNKAALQYCERHGVPCIEAAKLPKHDPARGVLSRRMCRAVADGLANAKRVLWLGPGALVRNMSLSPEQLVALAAHPIVIAPDFVAQALAVRRGGDAELFFQECTGQRHCGDSARAMGECAAKARGGLGVGVQVDPAFSAPFLLPEGAVGSFSRKVVQQIRRHHDASLASGSSSAHAFLHSFPGCAPAELQAGSEAVSLCLAAMQQALKESAAANGFAYAEPTAAPPPTPPPEATVFPVRKANERALPAGAPRIGIVTVAEYDRRQKRANSRNFMQFQSQSLTEHFTRYGFPNKLRYAQRWHYAMILESARSVDLQQQRHAAFAKLNALLKWIQPESAPGRLDWLMWMDADTLIMNHSLSIERHVLEPAAAVKREQLRKLGVAFNESDRAVNFDLIIARDWNGINSGVMFVRCSPWSRDFFTRVSALYRSPKCNGIPDGWWEQKYLICQLERGSGAAEDRTHVLELPAERQRVFNAYGPPADLGTRTATWRPGDFVAHWPNSRANAPECMARFRQFYSNSMTDNGYGNDAASLPDPPTTFYSPGLDPEGASEASAGKSLAALAKKLLGAK